MSDNKIQVGVIGCGAIGREHIERLTNVVPETKVVAVYDYVREPAETAAKQYGATVYDSGEALIRSDEVDAILVASTDDTHADYVMEALKQNKYVFCEKPLALTAKECEKMIEIETKQNKDIVYFKWALIVVLIKDMSK
ncbi:Gfo/Idh/MocA family protein [Tetragenococcus koreensis]|uniref:Gfo/Idh/MocA family protein n=1 Tax=Tetragenococcus koreensis TaxID=290335 RepID=UPI001F3A382C|nr:Gfo/Idh/MocA family oxidoreductase [Tetragenococcus koreensis]MCF1626728.1 Gfo/Idh/MocA family oxidoreductase [Tetragenococcus koreensis]